MKQEFINFLKALMDASPETTEKYMTPTIEAYIKTLTEVSANEAPTLTDNGKVILKYMQEHPEAPFFKARDIAEGIFVNSRGVSGSLRKLTNDGFVEKMGESPVLYVLTEKGKEYQIEE